MNVGIVVDGLLPTCKMALGSSAPAAKIPLGREYLKLLPTTSTPLASKADAIVSPLQLSSACH